jgi:hypothetical protein
MKTILCAVLTTNDIYACRRAVASIPEESDLVIVCNTLDDGYYKQLCSSELSCHTIIRTPCNGMPGSGKQSVIDYFLTTTYDYLLHLDGDDFLYPDAINILQTLIQERPADVYGLQNEDILIDNRIFTSWAELDVDKLVENLFVNNVQIIADYFEDVFLLMDNSYVRSLCISKRAASLVKYDSRLQGSEDLKFSTDLKWEHLQGNLEFLIVDNPEIHLYNKSNFSGAGYRFFLGDFTEYRNLYFEGFRGKKMRQLLLSELPTIKIEPKLSARGRLKYALKHLKKFKN